MSGFHDQVRDDIPNEFLDPDVFGEPHRVNGKAMFVVLDMDERTGDKNAAPYGIFDGDLVLFASTDDLPRGREGDRIDIDGRIYTAKVWRVDMGMNRITLESFGSY